MNFKYENQKIKQGYKFVIGCDEVGRGCLAGPVVAAAVVLDSSCKVKDLRDVRDSKLLSPEKREQLSAIIKEKALAWSIGEVSQELVDEINIHNASLLAMKEAVDGLAFDAIPESRSTNYQRAISGIQSKLGSGSRLSAALGRDGTAKVFLFVDGKFTVPSFAKATEGKPNLHIEQQAVIGGDNKILSIAAASIIAKVYRDTLMQKLDKQYPVYNFAQHKGYATLHHRQMITQNGLSPIHRLTFCQNLSV